MGCCFSAGNHHPTAEHGSSVDGAPPTSPPRVFEEETVKEVLVETPIVSTGIPPEIEPPAAVHPNSGQLKKDEEKIVPEVSDASEICSYSESLSTTAAAEKNDDEDGVVNQRPPPRKRRAHGGGRGRGERVVARRVAAPPPPEKRGQVTPVRAVRRPAPPENGRKVEDAVKRSRSPVRVPEARRNAGGEKIPAPEKGEFKNDVVSAEEAETLENPVVSLECFIFL